MGNGLESITGGNQTGLMLSPKSALAKAETGNLTNAKSEINLRNSTQDELGSQPSDIDKEFNNYRSDF